MKGSGNARTHIRTLSHANNAPRPIYGGAWSWPWREKKREKKEAGGSGGDGGVDGWKRMAACKRATALTTG